MKTKAITFYYDPEEGAISGHKFGDKFLLENGLLIADVLKDVRDISEDIYENFGQDKLEEFFKQIKKTPARKVK